MKKLPITKKQFTESKYFQKKYGKLAYVSESGKLFKTDKGNVLKFRESTKKFGRKFMKEGVGDIANDPAYVCPYCGGHNCEFSDGEDIGSGLQDGYFDGATVNTTFWCMDCEKPYNVQFKLKVSDVYPDESGDFDED